MYLRGIIPAGQSEGLPAHHRSLTAVPKWGRIAALTDQVEGLWT